jgi:methionyl-tRNA formyltransferase
MKYVFFGTPRFAAIILDRLIRAGMPPVALVCNPDRPVGRKKIVTPPPTKQLVVDEKLSVQIFQPEKLDTSFIEALRALKPDFFVVAAYAKIIPQAVLDIPRLGTLGTHPSLLPKYRGASPIQSVLLAGEEQTGTTIYAMDEKMDHGAIYAQEEVPLDALTTDYLTLEETLAKLSAQLLVKTIPRVLDGTAIPCTQDESLATFTKKFMTENGFIKYSELDAAIAGDSDKAALIVRTINAFTPEPGAWTIRNGVRVKLLDANIEHGAFTLKAIQEEGQKVKQL